MKLKIISYNIDGLPTTLDLKDLPLILRPIAYIYKLIKGTTIIKINDNDNKTECINNIGNKLKSSNADIIAIQEDFNYDDILMDNLYPQYNYGTWLGGFNLSKLFSSTEWFTCFPFPRFKADGINVLFNKYIKVMDEKIIRWKKSNGYFSHANDKLTHKGFRLYPVTYNDVSIDIYIVHMDADFYHPENCPDVSKDIKARKAQFKQLSEYIIKRNSNALTIIIGDTNSTIKYAWDVDNLNYFIDSLKTKSNIYPELLEADNKEDVDKAIIVNNKLSAYKINCAKCFFDTSYNGLSDHDPLVLELNIGMRPLKDVLK